MDRRTFLVGLGGWLILPAVSRADGPSDPPAAALVDLHGSDPKRLVREGLRRLGGIGRFVSRGDRVLVKPNMSWDRTPEQAANTHPQVVAAVVEAVLEAGAREAIVLDHTCNDPRRSYRRSGIAEAARAAGAKVRQVDPERFVRVDLGGEAVRRWPVVLEALEVDRIVNVPVAKHHSLATLTLSMKNLMGLVGGRRNRLHQKIHQVIPDLQRFFHPVLTVLDATRILVANGPQGGDPSDVRRLDRIVLSADAVAVDAYATRFFDLSPEDLPYVREAARRGLGQGDLRRVRIETVEVG
jgi:uncharacterized protein (DUF362 family)